MRKTMLVSICLALALVMVVPSAYARQLIRLSN